MSLINKFYGEGKNLRDPQSKILATPMVEIPQKTHWGARVSIFKPNGQNIETCILSKLLIDLNQTVHNDAEHQVYSSWLSKNVPNKSKMADGRHFEQEAQLSPRDRAMRRVNWNFANCHATVQKLLKLIRQVLTKSMVWSWRFSRRQCVTDNVHSTMTRSSWLPLSQVS